MLDLQVSELSDYSRSVVRLIGTHRPDWLKHTKLIETESASHKILEVSLPNGAPIGPIVILTEQDELTVWIADYYHTHFGGYSSVESEADFQETLDFIESVMSEESIIYWILHDEKWIQSGILDNVRIDLLKDVAPGDCRIYIRSWTGNYDQERSIDFDVFKKLW